MIQLDVEVNATLDGQRVDRVLSLLTGVPRRVAATLVADGSVRLDGKVVASRSTAVHAGQHLQAEVSAEEPPAPSADASVPFAVVHEDADLVVVDKPAGVVVHHGAGHHGGTLVDGLLARYPELGGLPEGGFGDRERPGIVHRLDKGTSGLLVVARSPTAYLSLSQQLREHTASRQYLALAVGAVSSDRGVVDAPIGRSARHPDRMTVSTKGRPARTGYRVRTRYHEPQPLSLLEVTLETGRTHQVRVHLAAIGNPVVGDDRYGAARARPAALVRMLGTGRLFLHAWRLTVDHPTSGERMSWESPLPPDLSAVLDTLS